MDQITTRARLKSRKLALWNERSSWITHWREISDNLMPRSGRFFTSDRNRGQKKHNNIHDSTAGKALNTLTSGLMAGMTSPARPWFRLAVPDPGLMKLGPVKTWLDDTTTLMRDIFARSNTYRALHSMYRELGGFGTGVSLILDDFDDVIRLHPLTVGEYAIATNDKGVVDTLYREFDVTVGNLVREFGFVGETQTPKRKPKDKRDGVSMTVKNLHKSGTLDAWVTIMHVIEPREDRDMKMKDNRNMAYKSTYFESSCTDDLALREGGFTSFRALVPRWDVMGGDIYGNSPAMESLGDIKQLQHEQLRKSEVIDYQTNPPLQLPMSMKNGESDLLPGGTSYYDPSSPGGGIRSAFNVELRLDYLLQDIQDVRGRIRENFFADLFMMIANDQRSNITAREIAERHEEKLLMLGPVLERLHNEMLSPLIDITFDRVVEAGILPPPPPEMQGMDLQVEFVSMLAQAQRAVGTSSIDRLIGTVGLIAQMKPEVLDKLDHDQLVDKYADMLGVDPDMILADDKVAIIRKDRAEQQASAQRAAMMPQAVDSAKTLSEIPADSEGTALSNLTRQFTQL